MYSSPNKSAITLISPIEPLSNPKNISEMEGSAEGLYLIFSRTVAAVTPSIASIVLGKGHEVICAGNEIRRNTRPNNAGLKILLPNPPNDILPIPIAAIAPMANIHNGRLDGTLNASNTPVMIADPSEMVGSFLNMKRCTPYSVMTQKSTENAVNINASRPNTYSDTIKAGTSAMSTPYIFLEIVSPL